jgi:hypothetical protein
VEGHRRRRNPEPCLRDPEAKLNQPGLPS